MQCFVVVSSMEIPRVPPTNLLKSGFAKVLVFLGFCKIHNVGGLSKIRCFVVVSSMEIPRVPPTNLLKPGFAKMLALLALQKCLFF